MTTTEETMMTDHTETRCRDCDGYNCGNGCAYPPKDTEIKIPDDVMRAANKVLRDNFFDKNTETVIIIARAILAERTRCARACGNFLLLKTSLNVETVVECEEAIKASVDK